MTLQLVAAIGPCIVACFVFLAVQAALPREKTALARAAGTIAFIVGAIVGMIAILGVPSFPARDAAQWLFYVGVAIALLIAAEPRWSKNAPLRVGVRTAAAGLALVAVLRPLIVNTWSTSTTALWLAMLLLLMVAIVESYTTLAERETSAIVTGLSLLIIVAGSVVMLFAGSAKLAQLGGAVASALGGIAILGAFRKQRYPIAGALAVAWALTALIWVQGYIFAEAPLAAMGAMIVAAFLPCVLQTSFVKRKATWQRAVIGAVVVTLPICIAIAIAYRAYTASASGYSY